MSIAIATIEKEEYENYTHKLRVWATEKQQGFEMPDEISLFYKENSAFTLPYKDFYRFSMATLHTNEDLCRYKGVIRSKSYIKSVWVMSQDDGTIIISAGRGAPQSNKFSMKGSEVASKTITIRCTSQQKENLKNLASKKGLSLTDYILRDVS